MEAGDTSSEGSLITGKEIFDTKTPPPSHYEIIIIQLQHITTLLAT